VLWWGFVYVTAAQDVNNWLTKRKIRRIKEKIEALETACGKKLQ